VNTIYIIPIEPIDQRYTQQWYDNIPILLTRAGMENSRISKIVTINGDQPKTGTTAGAFLDFAVTNQYKASQTQRVAEMFTEGKIKAGDKFLVTDAWNFIITAIRYMSDLLDIPVEIHGIWHAGAYDPTDILGMKMQKPWPWKQEIAWYYACDYNYYATDFHKNMFLTNLEIDTRRVGHKAIRSGQPHDLIIAPLQAVRKDKRDRTVIWPHRLNEDKQPEIIRDIATKMPVTITQDLNLTKAEYYDKLGTASVVFSCSLHENLGISQMEGVLAGCIPVVPDRASYTEMYPDVFKYPTEWTSSWENYQNYRVRLIGLIADRIENYSYYQDALRECETDLIKNYLNADIMIDKLLS
jgi:hypothetical protein